MFRKSISEFVLLVGVVIMLAVFLGDRGPGGIEEAFMDTQIDYSRILYTREVNDRALIFWVNEQEKIVGATILSREGKGWNLLDSSDSTKWYKDNQDISWNMKKTNISKLKSEDFCWAWGLVKNPDIGRVSVERNKGNSKQQKEATVIADKQDYRIWYIIGDDEDIFEKLTAMSIDGKIISEM